MGNRLLKATRPGGIGETAVSYALSPYASIVRVPREEDTGVDVICTLLEERDRCLYPQMPFYLQVKVNDGDNADKIIFEQEHEVKWLFELALPFYIALVYHKENPRIDIYSVGQRIKLIYNLNTLPKSLIIIPHLEQSHKSPDDNGIDTIYLGSPILSIVKQDYGKRDETIYQTLLSWVGIDMANINWRNIFVRYFLSGDYSTNVKPYNIIPWSIYSKTGTVNPKMHNNCAMIVLNMLHNCFPQPEQEPLQPNRKRLLFAFCDLFHYLKFNENEINGLEERFPQAISEWKASPPK